VTQQPGSIPSGILSQGDNWFIFHLLSSADLINLRRANAHFSEDLLSGLLNEPIPGQGVFWSSVGGKAYPIAVRTLSFEKMYRPHDPRYDQPAVRTFARELREKFHAELFTAVSAIGEAPLDGELPEQDALAIYEQRAINVLRENREVMTYLCSADGCYWGRLIGVLADELPPSWTDRNARANRLVPQALEEILGGPRNIAWHVVKDAGGKTRVKAGRAE
jgi:hypothetical protein